MIEKLNNITYLIKIVFEHSLYVGATLGSGNVKTMSHSHGPQRQTC